MRLRGFAGVAAVALVVAGCAPPRPVVHTQLQKPETMSPVDSQIALAECHKQGLLARKDFIAKNPGVSANGIDSPVYKVQQAATDQCLVSRGITIKSRTRTG